MQIIRTILILLLLFVCSGICVGQQPGPEFWRKLTCQPFEPRTTLEALEMKRETVVIRGFSQITTVDVRGVRIDAVEMRVLGGPGRAKGVVVALRESADRIEDNRAFVDYEELEPLLRAIDSLTAVDENSTKLVGFEAHYHTRGDLELKVFRQTQRLTAVTIQTGICTRATESLSLDELAKVRAMILEAKTRLDELR